jgi:exonuclease III
MTHIYKLTTINIQGITSDRRIKMLNHFLHTQDIDIALLQKITTSKLKRMLRCNVYMNRGTEGRGTAIITKEGLTATNNLRLPIGRGIAAEIKGTWIINL